jgi:hypothetical protein
VYFEVPKYRKNPRKNYRNGVPGLRCSLNTYGFCQGGVASHARLGRFLPCIGRCSFPLPRTSAFQKPSPRRSSALSLAARLPTFTRSHIVTNLATLFLCESSLVWFRKLTLSSHPAARQDRGITAEYALPPILLRWVVGLKARRGGAPSARKTAANLNSFSGKSTIFLGAASQPRSILGKFQRIGHSYTNSRPS